MKLCSGCRKQHEGVLKKLLKVEIVECKIEECEFGHSRFRPELPKELAEKTEELKEKTKHIKGSTWNWVYIDAPPIPLAWYRYLDCEDRTPPWWQCQPWQPSDTTKCDIHYEPWVYVNDLQEWFGGLVNFGGCNSAANCGGECGLVNSKRNGACLKKYNEAPEVFVDGWLWCLHDATGISDCLRRTQYMVLDYIP